MIERGIENTRKAIFACAGDWDIPKLKGTNFDIKKWQEEKGGIVTGFNYCKSYIDKQVDTRDTGVHFFLEDYQFERVWLKPTTYLDRLKQFKFVLTPDFSLYTDHPKAVQIFSHYKKHWVGAFWESQGLRVIPTICWSDSKSFEWCFDGEPINSVVAVSTKGTQGNQTAKERFLAGYNQMIKRLNPTQILLFGKNPKTLEGNVIEMGYEFDASFKKGVIYGW